MPEARSAAVAGSFYLADPGDLRDQVEYLLAGAAGGAPCLDAKVLIAPHAGYVYSGPVAAKGFCGLAPRASSIERIVLLGPAHHHPVRGLALPGVDVFETPLGRVRVDKELVDRIAAMPQISVSRRAHEPEHCLEVELPFLQVLLGEFTVLPLLVSRLSATGVADVLEAVWGGEETMIVISSDLSHFLPYEEARRVDRESAERILRLEPLDGFQACGSEAINGVLEVASRRRLSAELVDLRNSGDTAGDRARVVGYGAFSFDDAH